MATYPVTHGYLPGLFIAVTGTATWRHPAQKDLDTASSGFSLFALVEDRDSWSHAAGEYLCTVRLCLVFFAVSCSLVLLFYRSLVLSFLMRCAGI